MAAGCAITWIRALATSSVSSGFVFANGLHQRSSQPRVRPLLGKTGQIDDRRRFVAIQQFERLAAESAPPARITARAPASESASRPPTTAGSSPTRVKAPGFFVLGGDQT